MCLEGLGGRDANLDKDVAPEEPLLHIIIVNPFIFPEEFREVIVGDKDLEGLNPMSRSIQASISYARPR